MNKEYCHIIVITGISNVFCRLLEMQRQYTTIIQVDLENLSKSIIKRMGWSMGESIQLNIACSLLTLNNQTLTAFIHYSINRISL